MSFVSSKGNILCRLIIIELYEIFALINRAIKGLHTVSNHNITQLERPERLRSEAPPPPPPPPYRLMITHTIESYWIQSQKKTKSKSQIKRIRKNFNFFNFETNTTRDTPSEVA